VQTSGVEQLFDMAAVHSFYIGLLEEALGHSVPVPHEVVAGNGSTVSPSVSALERWLNLLDLAINPLMLRDALKETTPQETAEALLRHFARKASRSGPDRDKTDFIITFLYRSLAPEKPMPCEMNGDGSCPFEQHIYAIFRCQEHAQLPEEHRQLVREFPFICQEVDDCSHFDQLMDSGVIQRVREIKQPGESFYHPRVLATIAGYNVYFGSRFDHLFHQAALQIKKFAINVRQQGGSMMSRSKRRHRAAPCRSGAAGRPHFSIRVQPRSGAVPQNFESEEGDRFAHRRASPCRGRGRCHPRAHAPTHLS